GRAPGRGRLLLRGAGRLAAAGGGAGAAAVGGAGGHQAAEPGRAAAAPAGGAPRRARGRGRGRAGARCHLRRGRQRAGRARLVAPRRDSAGGALGRGAGRVAGQLLPAAPALLRGCKGACPPAGRRGAGHGLGSLGPLGVCSAPGGKTSHLAQL
ncbi:unnamed protein product, partial [Prorocentrum cordatum]